MVNSLRCSIWIYRDTVIIHLVDEHIQIWVCADQSEAMVISGNYVKFCTWVILCIFKHWITITLITLITFIIFITFIILYWSSFILLILIVIKYPLYLFNTHYYYSFSGDAGIWSRVYTLRPSVGTWIRDHSNVRIFSFMPLLWNILVSLVSKDLHNCS